MYTSIYSEVSKVRQVRYCSLKIPNQIRAKFHFDNGKLILQNHNTLGEGNLKLLLFTGYLLKIHAISVKRKEKSRETTGT